MLESTVLIVGASVDTVLMVQNVIRGTDPVLTIFVNQAGKMLYVTKVMLCSQNHSEQDSSKIVGSIGFLRQPLVLLSG